MCPLPSAACLNLQSNIIDGEIEPVVACASPGLGGCRRRSADVNDIQLTKQPEHRTRGWPRKPLEQVHQVPYRVDHLLKCWLSTKDTDNNLADMNNNGSDSFNECSHPEQTGSAPAKRRSPTRVCQGPCEAAIPPANICLNEFFSIEPKGTAWRNSVPQYQDLCGCGAIAHSAA